MSGFCLCRSQNNKENRAACPPSSYQPPPILVGRCWLKTEKSEKERERTYRPQGPEVGLAASLQTDRFLCFWMFFLKLGLLGYPGYIAMGVGVVYSLIFVVSIAQMILTRTE